ncbi:Uncharacterized protein TPAR_06501 [Tolypocladium paradoxum]|uniref:Uncharacterized protein n=1 Tax=Tolypocladium paradoxum TaxID=94208 RepID=A0A2S4KT22_9HYPO|nr:Uncharacterized protein TPAR_06501 [Tolypocladium paradoxum]
MAGAWRNPTCFPQRAPLSIPATAPVTSAIMDSLRGIEGSRPSFCSAKALGNVQASRSSSISLDGHSSGKAPSLHASVSVLHQLRQVDDCDSAKSPLLLMEPLELEVMDKRRDSSAAYTCPPLPSEPSLPSSSSPVLPLEAYLMDKNEHERRLLRLSRCPRVGLRVSGPSSGPEREGIAAASPVCGGGSSVDPPTSSWEYVECDNGEPQGPLSEPRASNQHTSHKRKLEAAEATDLEQGHREKLGRPDPVIETQSASLCIEPESVGAASVSSALSTSLPDSAISDILVARPSLAPRHLPLHRELQEAGLGGLGDSSNSLLRYHRAFDAKPSSIRVQKQTRRRRSFCKKDS